MTDDEQAQDVLEPVVHQALEPTFAPTPEQLSGVAVVIIIAVGVQTIIMLFIFAKRQIMRFTLRARRGPHMSVGQGSFKQLRREIDRRLDYVSHIRYEPRLGHVGSDRDTLRHVYRARAIDKVQELDTAISRYDLHFSRPAGANLRSFLIECLAGPLVGLDPRHVHRFCDLYVQARHSYHKFHQLELQNFLNLLQQLQDLVQYNREHKQVTSPKKSSDTPQHRKALNRPQKKVLAVPVDACNSAVTHRTSSAVLMSDQTKTDSTPTHV